MGLDGLTFGERMKKWFPPRKLIALAAVTVIYGLLYWWTATHQTGYLQQWLADRRWWEFWVVAAVMIALGLWAGGAGLGVGCVIGIPVAQRMGDAMDAYYQTVITPDMTAEELAAYGPRHAYMWWMTVIAFLILGLIVQLAVRMIRRRKQAKLAW